VPASELQTYREAIARYHLHPESKFSNGDYVDRGTTCRRHIRASTIRYIGKEANEIDRQQVLGAESEPDPKYGLSDGSVAQIREALAELVSLVGKAGAAKALHMPSGQLGLILSDRASLEGAAAGGLATVLPAELAQARRAAHAHQLEAEQLFLAVRTHGLRATARRLSVDASNLRRKIRKLSANR